jgi:hypothetical protein
MPGQDQIIGAVMARSIQADAARRHPLLAWVVTQDEGTYHGHFVGRLLTNAPTPYVLLADTLGELHAQLPSGVMWSDRQPADPPEVVEIWFLPPGINWRRNQFDGPAGAHGVLAVSSAEIDRGRGLPALLAP